MPYLKTVNDEIVRSLLDKRAEVIEKQLLIPSSTTITMLRLERQRKGIINSSDVRELSAEQIAQLRDMAEHYPLVYLVYIGRFDVVRELFGEEKRLAQQLAVIAEIEREEAKAAHAKELWVAHDQQSLKNRQLQSEQLAQEQRNKAEQATFNWTHPDINLSNSEKLQHYENELIRITTLYHNQRDRIHSNSIAADIQDDSGYIDRMIRALSPNVPAEQQAILELKTIKRDAIRRQQEIDNISVRKPDGTLDLDATAARKERAREQFKFDLNTRMDSVFNRLESSNPEINAIRAERAVAIQRDVEEIRELDQAFAAQKTQLQAQIEQARHAVMKEKALDNLNEIIKAAKDCEVDQSQKEQVDNSIKNLEHLHAELAKTDDWASVQTLMQDCKAELAQLKERIPDIKPEIEALEKLVVEPEWMQPPPPAYDGIAREPQLSSESVSLIEEPDINSPPSEIQQAAATQDRVDETQNRSVPSVPIQNAALSEEALQAVRNDQERYRAGVRSPERQLKMVLDDISSKTEDLVNDEDADERLRAMAITMQEQIAIIKSHANYQEVPDDIKESFVTALNEFGDVDEEFIDFKDKYASMFEPTEPLSHQHAFSP